MSSCINNVPSGKAYPLKSDYQSNSENKKKSKKNGQIVTENEGQYKCIYIVDGKGNKTLLEKVPITQEENQKNLSKDNQYNETKSCDNSVVKGDGTVADCKEQMDMSATHRKNLHEIMDIIDWKVGIPSNSKKLY